MSESSGWHPRDASRIAVVLLVGIVLVGAVPAVGGEPGGPAASSAVEGPVLQQSFEPDGVVMTVDLHDDGTASWTVRYRLDIRTANETAAFEELRADIRENTTTYIASFRTRIRTTVAEAENATGREMRATNFSVRTRTESLSESGFVTYSFTWEGFATVDGETIHAGDAVSGLFLDADTTLTMTWSADLERYSVEPDPTSSSDHRVTWEGRRTFGLEEPRLVVGPPQGLGLVVWLPLLAVGVALVGAVVYFVRRRSDGAVTSGVSTAAESETGSEATDETEEAGETEPPSDLLSNEEQVLQLLEERGGRAKQQEVVSGLDWTEAKTSQVVTDMREAGDIEVFRIGRENVIKLPDADLEGETADEDGQDDQS